MSQSGPATAIQRFSATWVNLDKTIAARQPGSLALVEEFAARNRVYEMAMNDALASAMGIES